MSTTDLTGDFRDRCKGDTRPPGYNKIRVNFVFDFKNDGKHKARLVAGGHMTEVHLESV